MTAKPSPIETLLDDQARPASWFRAMFEQAPLGIALIDSLDGGILAVNQRFADIVGRSRGELARIDWMSITHPDDIQADLDNMARLNAVEIGGFQMNKRYFRPDGGIVWASMTIAPVQVERGERPRHLAMIEDITERLRTEAELAEARDRSARRESEERLRLAIDGAHLGTWHWHLPSNELVWSVTCKALFGLPPDSTISYDEFLDILHPDDRQFVDWLARQSLASHDDFAADYRVIWPDGSIHWISALGRVFLAADGSAERMEGVTFDITARKQDEELLRRASAEMEARNRITRVFLTVPGEGMYTEVLNIVLETLQSPYGVFGYLDEQGDLVVPTMTRTVWDQCQIPDKRYVFKRDEWGDSIWPTAIRQK
ncbi:MAG: PAS domain S-box protein, partial [Methylococcus sp.]